MTGTRHVRRLPRTVGDALNGRYETYKDEGDADGGKESVRENGVVYLIMWSGRSANQQLP